MGMARRIIPSVALILAVCIIAGVSAVRERIISTNAPVTPSYKIIIDPGHGGIDGGAEAEDGTDEKDLNLLIALKLRSIMRLYGYEVIMTRTKDSSTDNSSSGFNKKGDLDNRLQLMKENPDAIFVSIHLNKFTTSAASGAQVFYSQKSDYSKELGQSIQDSVVKHIQPENKRVIKRGTDSTYILKNATVPAVIVECGFLSNKAELQLLKDEDYQRKMAFCIAAGIIDFNLKY